jgi:hypothetical protein
VRSMLRHGYIKSSNEQQNVQRRCSDVQMFKSKGSSRRAPIEEATLEADVDLGSWVGQSQDGICVSPTITITQGKYRP